MRACALTNPCSAQGNRVNFRAVWCKLRFLFNRETNTAQFYAVFVSFRHNVNMASASDLAPDFLPVSNRTGIMRTQFKAHKRAVLPALGIITCTTNHVVCCPCISTPHKTNARKLVVSILNQFASQLIGCFYEYYTDVSICTNSRKRNNDVMSLILPCAK